MAKTQKRNKRLVSGKSRAESANSQKTEKKGRGKNHSHNRPKQEAQAAELRPIKRRRRKRIRLGEAFRKVGLDEQTVAETYVGVVENLRSKSAENTVQKLLVDVLKECSRVLEPPRSGGAGASDQPTIVELHHAIPRPERDEFAGAEDTREL